MSFSTRRERKVTIAMSESGLPEKPAPSKRSLFRRFFDIDDPANERAERVESTTSGIWPSSVSGVSSMRERRDGKRKALNRTKSLSNLSAIFNSTSRNDSQATFTPSTPKPAAADAEHPSQSDSQLLSSQTHSRRNRLKAKKPLTTSSGSVTPSIVASTVVKNSRSIVQPTPSFELTPLSGLIKQSYKDIEALKMVHAGAGRGRGKVRFGEEAASSGGVGEGEMGELGMGIGMAGAGAGKRIDFEKVEENLRRFEEVYRSFLRYGGPHGESQEEVHLVAMVCKRSEVINGKMGSSDSVPVAKVPDCGL